MEWRKIMDGVNIKEDMKRALMELGASEINGTEILDVKVSGKDVFDEYPIIRILPNGVEREIEADNRIIKKTYKYIISVYLELNEGVEGVSEEMFDVLNEFGEKIIDKLDNEGWLRDKIERYAYREVNGINSGNIGVVESSVGSVIYCDVNYDITVCRGF